MADTTTNSVKLIVGLTNSEDKLKKFSLPNPRQDLTESEVRAAVSTLLTSVGVIDDTTDGETFSTSSIETAYIEGVTKIDLDIT